MGTIGWIRRTFMYAIIQVTKRYKEAIEQAMVGISWRNRNDFRTEYIRSTEMSTHTPE